jgi:hypothetical protein
LGFYSAENPACSVFFRLQKTSETP